MTRLLRRLLSLFGICLLVVGIYFAVKGFSGYDPLAVSQAAVLNALSSKGQEMFGTTVLQAVSHAVGYKGLPQQQKKTAFTIGLVADSHTDNAHLAKALAQLKAQGITTVLGLGDYTNVGTMQELADAKATFDQAGVTYYVIPGDHDFWDSKNKGQAADTNYQAVFGPSYQAVTIDQMPILLLNNADDDTGMGQTELDWLKQQLTAHETVVHQCQSQQQKSPSCRLPFLVFMHEPLYHPTTQHVMGRVSATADAQRKMLIPLLKQSDVTEVISGDLHFFSRYTEPVTSLPMTTLGAITEARNPQTPRYATLTVYTDGSYDITDHEIQ